MAIKLKKIREQKNIHNYSKILKIYLIRKVLANYMKDRDLEI